MTVRLVLVDDHQLFREGLRSLLSGEIDLEVVGEAGDARTAYQVVETERPDVVVLDVGLPGTCGISATREIRRRIAEQRILVLSMHFDEEFVAQALSAGASGYVLKQQSRTELADAVRQVAGGRRYLSPRISRPAVDHFLSGRNAGRGAGPLGNLSARESEIFDLLVRGHSNDGIASQLSISVKTVETHRAHILKKLRVHSLVDLVRFASRHRLITDENHMVADESQMA